MNGLECPICGGETYTGSDGRSYCGGCTRDFPTAFLAQWHSRSEAPEGISRARRVRASAVRLSATRVKVGMEGRL